MSERVTVETLTMRQIADAERYARAAGNKALLLACQRAACTSRQNLASMRRVAEFINAQRDFIAGLRSKAPR